MRAPHEMLRRGGGGRGGGGAADARRARVVRGRDGLADHLVGLLDAALDAGADDRLAREALRLAHVDVGGEDHGVGVVDDARRHRLVAARALRLDGEVDAGLLAGGGERVGGHERVGDAGRARGDGDDAGGAPFDAEPVGDGRGRGRRRAARRPPRRRGSGIPLADRVAHDRDDLVGARRGAQAAREVVLHEAAGELREHREVRLGGTLGRRDEEDEVGGSVGSAEVDAGLRAARTRATAVTTAALLACGIAMPPGRPVSSFCSRAQASAKSASASVARPCATTRAARARMTAALSAPRPTSRLNELWRDGLGHDDLQWSVVRCALSVTRMVFVVGDGRSGGVSGRRCRRREGRREWEPGCREGMPRPRRTGSTRRSRSAGSAPSTSASR